MVKGNRTWALCAALTVTFLAAWMLNRAGYVLLAGVATSVAVFLLLDPFQRLYDLGRRDVVIALAIMAGAALLLLEAAGW